MDHSFVFLVEEQGLPPEKIDGIREEIKLKARQLIKNPYLGQKELLLEHLNKDYRRLIEGHFKIVYFLEKDIIYITDIFDARQDPEKMKG